MHGPCSYLEGQLEVGVLAALPDCVHGAVLIIRGRRHHVEWDGLLSLKALHGYKHGQQKCISSPADLQEDEGILDRSRPSRAEQQLLEAKGSAVRDEGPPEI